MSTTSITSYEEAVASHEWRVPERYNIAQDVYDKHPADKLAMIHEHFDGTVREVRWGELQELSNRFANVLRAHGVQKGDRVAMLLPPTPETAAAFFGMLLNFLFLFAGTVSTNPWLLLLGMIVFIAGANAGRFGLDYYLMPLLRKGWAKVWRRRERKEKPVAQ